MPSPFPGMDPFIEGQKWGNFHPTFLGAARDFLNARVMPRYVTDYEQSVWLLSEEDEEGDAEVTLYRPDLDVERADFAAPPPDGGGPVATLEPRSLARPAPATRRVRHRRLAVLEARSKAVVTVIELLSPWNKVNPGRREYLAKQNELLRAGVNLVELDLLRGGRRLPTVQPLPAGDHHAFVTEPTEGWTERVDVYSWGLRDALPTIPVPLAGDDPPVGLDLAAAFAAIYDPAGYGVLLDRGVPVMPPLSEGDAGWVGERIFL